MGKTSEAPSIDAVLAVQEYREAEEAALAADTRPRSTSVDGIGEGLLFYRWTAEQVLTIHNRLLEAGHSSNNITGENDADRGHCIKIIQIGLYDGRKLAYPGLKGFNEIGRQDNETLSRLASQALAFNEVF